MIKKFLICSALALSCTIHAWALETPDENQVKAAFLYNFAKFIEWPADSFEKTPDEFIIGVIGPDRLEDELKPLIGRKVKHRIIDVAYYSSIQQIQNCHLLYIGSNQKDFTVKALQSQTGKPVVTVGDIKDFAKLEGIIQLVAVRGRLRFIINQKVASAKEIKINSQLLKLAIEIIGDNR